MFRNPKLAARWLTLPALLCLCTAAQAHNPYNQTYQRRAASATPIPIIPATGSLSRATQTKANIDARRLVQQRRDRDMRARRDAFLRGDAGFKKKAVASKIEVNSVPRPVKTRF
jgi:hypothetical protein